MSNFNSDLNTEKILAKYLDGIYNKLGFNFKRVFDSKSQNKGIDIIISHAKKSFAIDEKSQLYYLNQELPTFAFELSYLKENVLKKGWLFDKKKETDYYFLVTSIILKDGKAHIESETDIKSLKIISVNRQKLIELLRVKVANIDNLQYLIYTIRDTKAYGQHTIIGLDMRKEGNIHFTENLSEQPINLVLKLDYLLKMGVAKAIYPNR